MPITSAGVNCVLLLARSLIALAPLVCGEALGAANSKPCDQSRTQSGVYYPRRKIGRKATRILEPARGAIKQK